MPSQWASGASVSSAGARSPTASGTVGVDARGMSQEIADLVAARLRADLRDTQLELAKELKESMQAELKGMQRSLKAVEKTLSHSPAQKSPTLTSQPTSTSLLSSLTGSWTGSLTMLSAARPRAGAEGDSRELVQQDYERLPQLPPGDSDDDDVQNLTNRTRATSGNRISRPTYNMECLDSLVEGCLGPLVESPIFRGLGLIAILLNTTFLLYVTDYCASHLSQRQHWMVLADQVFLAFYTVELLFRMLAKGRRYFGSSAEKYWNIFDLSVVVVGIAEVVLDRLSNGDWPLMAGMVRATRVFKFLRLIRTIEFFEELKRMSTAVLHSFGLLFFAIMFLLMILMMASLYFVQSMATFLMEQDCDDPRLCGQIPAMFGSVLRSMLVLLQSTTGGISWGDVYEVLSLAGWINAALYVAYILFFTFAFFNVVVGIFVDNAIKHAAPSDHVKMKEQRQEQEIQIKHLQEILEGMDMDNTGGVSVKELAEAFEEDRDKVNQRMQILGITARQAMLLLSTLARDKEEASIEEFVDQLVHFIGPASGIDLHKAAHDLKELSLEIRAVLPELQTNRTSSKEVRISNRLGSLRQSVS